MTLSTSLAAAVGETIRDRGRAYYRAGAVNVVTLGAAVCVATGSGSTQSRETRTNCAI